jgi:hypothetical protein
VRSGADQGGVLSSVGGAVDPHLQLKGLVAAVDRGPALIDQGLPAATDIDARLFR